MYTREAMRSLVTARTWYIVIIGLLETSATRLSPPVAKSAPLLSRYPLWPSNGQQSFLFRTTIRQTLNTMLETGSGKRMRHTTTTFDSSSIREYRSTNEITRQPQHNAQSHLTPSLRNQIYVRVLKGRSREHDTRRATPSDTQTQP